MVGSVSISRAKLHRWKLCLTSLLCQVPARFGLIDDSPLRWVKFEAEILKLQVEAPKGTKYKVLYVGRHGQGFRMPFHFAFNSRLLANNEIDNLAEATYGTPASSFTDLIRQQG